MKIKELVEKLDRFDDDEREKWLPKLMGRFTPESLGQIMNFQNRWVNSDKAKGVTRPFEEFKKEQNKVILDCIKIEGSRLGTEVRDIRGLPIWDNEEEL